MDPVLRQFFAFHAKRPAPKLAIRCVSPDNTVQLVSLRVRQTAIVEHPFYLRFKTCTGFKRRTLGRTVEENIKLDLQPANIVFQFAKLFIYSDRFFETARPSSI